jgi:hypothetical protein
LSTFGRRLPITAALEETLRPPMMDKKVCWGFPLLCRILQARITEGNRHRRLKKRVTPIFEACALCDVPKASLTKTSAKEASAFETQVILLFFFVKTDILKQNDIAGAAILTFSSAISPYSLRQK